MKEGINVFPCKSINSTSSLASFSNSSFFPNLQILLPLTNKASTYKSSSNVNMSPLKYNFSFLSILNPP